MQSEPSSQDEPKGLCKCGHAGHAPRGRGYPCTTQGCDCKWYTLVTPEPTIINNRCRCSHDRFHHQHVTKTDGSCWDPDCDCKAYAPVTVETVELPEPEWHECDNCNGYDPSTCMFNRRPVPQPERRPPLSVAYSVAGGHAYEVSIPGDASVTALDGALIITHPDAQVLAITHVAPIKES